MSLLNKRCHISLIRKSTLGVCQRGRFFFRLKAHFWKGFSLYFFLKDHESEVFFARIFQQAIGCHSEGMHLDKANDSPGPPPSLVPLQPLQLSFSLSASISSFTAPPSSPSLSPLIYIKSILLPRPCYLSIPASSLDLPPCLCVISMLCWFAVVPVLWNSDVWGGTVADSVS